MYLSAEAVVQDPAALLPGEIGGGEQTDKIRFLPEALIQNGQLLSDLLIQLLVRSQSIQSFSVNTSDPGHTSSPSPLMKLSIRSF